jgi:hypothetical protein
LHISIEAGILLCGNGVFRVMLVGPTHARTHARTLARLLEVAPGIFVSRSSPLLLLILSLARALTTLCPSLILLCLHFYAVKIIVLQRDRRRRASEPMQRLLFVMNHYHQHFNRRIRGPGTKVNAKVRVPVTP